MLHFNNIATTTLKASLLFGHNLQERLCEQKQHCATVPVCKLPYLFSNKVFLLFFFSPEANPQTSMCCAIILYFFQNSLNAILIGWI